MNRRTQSNKSQGAGVILIESANAALLRSRIGRRFGRRRSGTVLIFVIALLVLMALIGTAYISTTRQDTYSSHTNMVNTQVDLLLEGGKNIAVGRIVDSIFGTNAGAPTVKEFRQASETGNLSTYLNYTSLRDSTFLASRVPESGPVWPYISDPVITTSFDDPTAVASAWFPVTRATASNYAIGSATGADGTIYPTLGGHVAGDTDGDGIADSGLIRIPMKDLDGLTWYYGFRIIDNNSAVNAATAWKWNNDYSAMPGNFFPGNIDLSSLLATVTGGDGMTDIDRLNQYRFNFQSPSSAGVLNPIADTGAARTDFSFVSPYDALWSQLGRRLGNPGYVAANTKYQALSWSDAISLASHFCVVPTGSTSNVATLLSQSDVGPTSAFAANDFGTWYNNIFNYTAGMMPAKPLIVARNAVSDAVSGHYVSKGAWAVGTAYAFGDWVTDGNHAYACIQSNTAAAGNQPSPTGGSLYWEPMPWSTVPVRTSINTGSFGQLWLAFWNVMTDAKATVDANPIFRSSIRDPQAVPTNVLTHLEELKLRAALAAVNAMDLRDGDDDVTSRKITICSEGTANPKYDVMVYGTEKQPYITEMFLHVDVDPTKVYMALELYNPYPTPITLTNWQLATLDRSVTGYPTMAPLAMVPPTSLSAITIAPNWYVVLESSAAARPLDLTADFTTRAITPQPEMPGLAAAIGKEIVLLRPRRADGTLTTSTDPTNPFNEANLGDLIPVDQIDTTGLETPPAVGAANRFLYRRASDVAATPSMAWHWVYPGLWQAAAALGGSRESGMVADPGNATGTPTLVGNLGAADELAGTANSTETYTTIPLQIANVDTAGPLKTTTATGNKFPFGAFARNGDILQVPFIGAYRIQAAGALPTAPVIEMNGVGKDSVFADDQFAGNDPQAADTAASPMREQLGRFCPLGAAVGTTYDWASDLFDFLTVEAPSNDYLPNVDPNPNTVTTPAAPSANVYPGATPQPVANSNPAVYNALTTNPGHATEDTVGVEGLININTAPARILATLPMLDTPALNDALAVAIVADRRTNGPFKSLFDLYRVPGFRLANDSLIAADADDVQGDLSPFGPTVDQVRYDFEERYLLLNRISNLITTRSDSFTVYVLVEGWQDAGNPAKAKRVVQRRAAYLVDRTSVTPIVKDPQTVYVPND